MDKEKRVRVQKTRKHHTLT